MVKGQDPQVPTFDGASALPDAGSIPAEDRTSYVIAHAIDLFRGAGPAIRWLAAPNMALGETRPCDLLDTERWRDVDDILGRIEHGIVS